MTLRTIRQQLASALEQLERGAGQLEKYILCLVGFATIIYLGIVFVLASNKLFWNDELYTFYFSRLHSLDDIWRALLTGTDTYPLPFYIITRASTALFGSGELAFRLPQIFGFWLMCISLFYFVRRRSSTAYGLVAMLFPLITYAFDYAYEARGYGLVVGFCGLALCCWQVATEGRLRMLSVTGLGLSLAGALSCHYYAILAFGPLIVGEVLRSVRGGRLDFGIWIAFGVGLIPLAIFLPLIKAAALNIPNFWAAPHWGELPAFYSDLLAPPEPALHFLVVAIILTGIYSLARPSKHWRTIRPANSIPTHEIAAVAGFALLPLGEMILAQTITNAFTDQYTLPSVIGLSAIFAWTLFLLMDRRPGLGLAVAAIILATFVAHGLGLQQSLRRSMYAQAATIKFLQSNNDSRLPIVIAVPHQFFELSHYAADKVGTRLVYLDDVSLGLKYAGTDTPERHLLAMREWAPLDVEDFHRFCASQREFLVYSHPGDYAWVIPELKRQGRRLVVQAENGRELLYFVASERAQSDNPDKNL